MRSSSSVVTPGATLLPTSASACAAILALKAMSSIASGEWMSPPPHFAARFLPTYSGRVMPLGTARSGDTTPLLIVARSGAIPGSLLVEAMLMSSNTPDQAQYFFNTRTKTVETGQLSSWEDLMGPYSTRAEAERALETAKKRSESWDDDDADWQGRS